jgi:hypothetical protein
MTPEKEQMVSSEMKLLHEKENEAWKLVNDIKDAGYIILPSELERGKTRKLKEMEELVFDLQKLHEIMERVLSDSGEVTHTGDDESFRTSELIMGKGYFFVPDHEYLERLKKDLLSKYEGDEKIVDSAIDTERQLMVPRYIKIVAEFSRHLSTTKHK